MDATAGHDRIVNAVKIARDALQGAGIPSDENVLRLALWLEAGPEVCAATFGGTVVKNR